MSGWVCGLDWMDRWMSRNSWAYWAGRGDSKQTRRVKLYLSSSFVWTLNSERNPKFKYGRRGTGLEATTYAAELSVLERPIIWQQKQQIEVRYVDRVGLISWPIVSQSIFLLFTQNVAAKGTVRGRQKGYSSSHPLLAAELNSSGSFSILPINWYYSTSLSLCVLRARFQGLAERFG